jgi:hypothetical protein
MTGFNGRDLASRVAGLLHGRFKGDLVAAACELDVDPDGLRSIVEEQTNHPDLDILAKLVQHFGIDVCWLMTGEYDWQGHMHLLEDEDDTTRNPSKQLLLRLAERRHGDAAAEARRRIG